MKEDLLQYIWKFQLYNSGDLKSTDEDVLTIIHPGLHNQNQGPDFNEAKIKIKDTIWAGNIEIHIRSSEWETHNHSLDKNYRNIILHVVWIHDKEISDYSGNTIPTLELQSRVSNLLLKKYQQLMDHHQFIPCENQIPAMSELALTHWKQRLVIERLIQKSQPILLMLHENDNHWEETFWWLIAANFGLKVNSYFFQKIAQSLPNSILAKHKNNQVVIEALLFGQAGLLDRDFVEKYPLMLQKEYQFYRKKYQLNQIDGELQFLRMRPANFPTIRLAQLAQLISHSEHLFSKIKESKSIDELKKMFQLTANDYWHYHYVFEEETDYKVKKMGNKTVENIIINTIVPIIFCYGHHHQEDVSKEMAIDWLEKISPEKNYITKGFEQLHFDNKNAFDSQALIQLKNEYCDKKMCLHCAIGNSILTKK
ncbi:MAG: DUF2851 family protein [Ginsengibacter sp.]